MYDRVRTALVLSIATACALALAPAAAVAVKRSNLRVEALGRTLDPGTNYSNGRMTSRNSNACGDRDSRRERLRGGSAMSLIANAAEDSGRLAPFRTSDTFSSEAGLIACQIGAYKGFDDRSWLYRVNLRSPNRSADRKRVGRRDDVLWYFADFSNGRNTGDALELRRVPAVADPGEELQVRVFGYPFSGSPAPAAGVEVTRAPEPTAADGTTTVTARSNPGVMRLRASDEDAIRSEREKVCVGVDADRCRGR